MPRIHWPLRRGRPCIEIVLRLSVGGQLLRRNLLADTGAGSRHVGFELILDEEDCLLCGGVPYSSLTLGGAYVGAFPIYGLSIQVPAIQFAKRLRVVGVPSVPAGFDGLACFRFLNRFTYGNFGDPDQFGLEV